MIILRRYSQIFVEALHISNTCLIVDYFRYQVTVLVFDVVETQVEGRN